MGKSRDFASVAGGLIEKVGIHRSFSSGDVASNSAGGRQSRRLGVQHGLQRDNNHRGGRIIHDHGSKQPTAWVDHAERGDKVHDARRRGPVYRLYVELLNNRLLLLGHAVLRKLGFVDSVRFGAHPKRKRVHRTATNRGEHVRIQDRKQGFVLRGWQFDNREHYRAVPERECGA